jgi:hypothetical protein
MKSIRIISWLTIATLAFFAMAASSPQCARSDDQALNPTFAPLGEPGNPCIDACVTESQGQKTAEGIRRKAALEACNGDIDCRHEVNTISGEINAEIISDSQDCKKACLHEQGEATGGQ